MNRITKVELSKLWGKYDFVWDSVNPDINVLVGINGGGKSTLLKLIRDTIVLQSKEVLKRYFITGCRVTFEDGTFAACGGDFGKSTVNEAIRVEYINIFENLFGFSKIKKGDNILDCQLDTLIYQRNTDVANFTNYRLKATNQNSDCNINDNIKKFFGVVNNLFKKTHKVLEIADDNITLQFRDYYDNLIPLRSLSSGEKQMLIILLKIFLMENAPCILLFDEPEISLHVDWQEKFIATIFEMNPMAQIVLSTHSPSIFSDGWNDKLVFIEDLVIFPNA